MAAPNQYFRVGGGQQVDTRDQALFVGVVCAAAAYVVGCAFYLSSLVDLIGMAHRAADGDPVSVADELAALDRRNELSWLVIVMFFVMLILFFWWLRNLGRRLAYGGHPGMLRAMPAYKVWRIGIWVVFFLSFVLTVGSAPQLADAAGLFTREAAYAGMRMVIGCLYIWCAISMRRAAVHVAGTTRRPVVAQPLIYPMQPPPPADYGYAAPGGYLPPPAGFPPPPDAYPPVEGYPPVGGYPAARPDPSDGEWRRPAS